MRATFTILFGLILFLPAHIGSDLKAPEEPALSQPPLVEAVEQKPYRTSPSIKVDPTEYKKLLREIASAKGLSDEKVLEIEATIAGREPYDNPICPNGESGWYPKAVGDNGDSIGMVQINLPSHPHITREQAEDPVFALTFIVDEFIAGNEWKWTCWKALYASK